VINVVVAERKIWAYALKNSIDYGSANANVVFSKIARLLEDKSSEAIEEARATYFRSCKEIFMITLVIENFTKRMHELKLKSKLKTTNLKK
jgi:hypothetical protein